MLTSGFSTCTGMLNQNTNPGNERIECRGPKQKCFGNFENHQQKRTKLYSEISTFWMKYSLLVGYSGPPLEIEFRTKDPGNERIRNGGEISEILSSQL